MRSAARWWTTTARPSACRSHPIAHGWLHLNADWVVLEPVDRDYRPAPLAVEMMEKLAADGHFTMSEVARFNLEFNSDPLLFRGDCLRRMEAQLSELLAKASRTAHQLDSEVVMIGILPTIDISDLTLENMTPKPRYFALNEAMRRLRGKDWEFYIKGTDELIIRHDSVMVEACNTSFQAHYQVGPEEFADFKS